MRNDNPDYTRSSETLPEQSKIVAGTMDMTDWDLMMTIKEELHCSFSTILRMCVRRGLPLLEEESRELDRIGAGYERRELLEA